MSDELNFSVGAREIYDEVKGLRADVQHAFSNHEDLKDEVSKIDSAVNKLKVIVYGLVPVMTILGSLLGKFWL